MKKFLSFVLFAISINGFALQRQLLEQELAERERMREQVANNFGESESTKKFSQKFEAFKNNFKEKVGRACFKGGTLVLEENHCKAIEDISIGDRVLSFEEDSGILVLKDVEDVFRLTASSLMRIELDDGRIIESTLDHPFYSSEVQDWVPAEELRELDWIQTTHKPIQIRSLHIQELEEPIQVYDIRVASTHNYFVVGNGICSGNETGVLVHNCDTAADFGKGFAVGASEGLPLAPQTHRKGNEVFEDGRASGRMASGAAQVLAGTAGVIAGEGAATISCMGAACAAMPAGVSVAASSATMAAHGAFQFGQGAQHFYAEGQKSGRSQSDSGKGANRLRYDENAEGPHSTYARDKDGNVYKYETYDMHQNGETKFFNPQKRFDGGKPDGTPGKPHRNKQGQHIETPHVQGKDVSGGVRPPRQDEIPNNPNFK